jgi:hypothetical protein
MVVFTTQVSYRKTLKSLKQGYIPTETVFFIKSHYPKRINVYKKR